MTNTRRRPARGARRSSSSARTRPIAHPIIGFQIKKAVRERGAKLIVADPRRIPLVDLADALAAAEARHERRAAQRHHERDPRRRASPTATSSPRAPRASRRSRRSCREYPPERVAEITGVPADDIRAAARLYAGGGPAAICYTMGITQHTTGTDNVLSLANLAMLTGNIGKRGAGVNPLRGQNNVQGACDMGGLPNYYTGYQKVADPAARAKFEKAWGVTLPPEPGLHARRDGRRRARGHREGALHHGREPARLRPGHRPRQARRSRSSTSSSSRTSS